jgi:antitoxin HicB
MLKSKLDHYLKLNYPVEMVVDGDAFVASFPDLPGCVSYAETVGEAYRNLKSTQKLWIKGQLDSRRPVPEPSHVEDFSGKFVLRIPRGLHQSLDRKARKQGVSLNHYISHVLSECHGSGYRQFFKEGEMPPTAKARRLAEAEHHR